MNPNPDPIYELWIKSVRTRLRTWSDLCVILPVNQPQVDTDGNVANCDQPVIVGQKSEDSECQ